VSNAAGYLCHIHLECDFDVRPQVLFDIFSHPGQTAAEQSCPLPYLISASNGISVKIAHVPSNIYQYIFLLLNFACAIAALLLDMMLMLYAEILADNAGAFRDIKQVGYRKVCTTTSAALDQWMMHA